MHFGTEVGCSSSEVGRAAPGGSREAGDPLWSGAAELMRHRCLPFC